MAIPTRITWHIEREGPTAKLHLASRSRVGYGLFVFFFAAAVVIGVLLSTTGSSPGSYYFLYGFLALLGIPVAIAIRHLNAASTGTVELDPESRVLRRTKGLRMMAEETVGIPSPGTLVLEHYVHMVRTSPGNGPGSTRHQSMQRDYYRLSVIPERVGRNDNISAIIEDRDITIKATSSPQKEPLALGAVLVVEGHDEKAVRKIGHFVCEELELLLLDASLLEPRLLEPADWQVSLATLRASIRESFPPPPPGQETPAFQRVRAGDQSWQIVCGGYSPRGLVLVALVGLVVAACIGGLA